MKSILKSTVLFCVYLSSSASLAQTVVDPAAKAKGAVASQSICEVLQKAVAGGAPAQKLKKYMDESWKYGMRESPEFATYAGVPGYNDKLTDNSLEATKRRKLEAKCSLAILKKVSRAALKGQDLVSYDLLVRNLELGIEGQKFDFDYLVMDHMSGFHIDFPDLLDSMPKASVRDYENMLARLEKASTYLDNVTLYLKEGLKRKVTPVKSFVARVPGQIEKILPDKVEDSPLFGNFKEFKSDIPVNEQKRLQARAKEILSTSVYPAFKKLKGFLVDTYIPGARTETAMSSLPNGKDWYAYLVKTHTTTAMSAKDLHELGLKEVERITKAMEKIKDDVKFKGDLQEFNQFLLSDSQFFYSSAKDLMTGYRDVAKQIDAQLPTVFKRLPRLSYGVREMPAYKAPEAPTAYYMGGSIEGGRAGYFEANTYDLKARPKWGMEALTLHEAMPGHHLQIALAQEIEGLPEFRKFGGFTSYIEGWGLYAESLGENMGFYKDPYSNYGRYTYEMWRAVRLVVDTGLHEFGWTREKAIDYFMAKMPKKKIEAEQEIDRYITIPGQALAYKVGQLKFLELRERAKAILADKYDIRNYHDEVLRHGALPLDVLEKVVAHWLEEQKKDVSTHKTR